MEDSVLTEQELKIVELDPRYSTTRRLSKINPKLENNPADKIKSRLFSSSKNPGKIHGGLRCSGYFKYAFPEHLLITVITVVYNGDNHLEQTIQSVINQTYNNIEYIIIDGGSTDRTLNIIRQYEGMIDYWVSEPDKGIADAMNKGLSYARGEYIAFIHADDYLENDNRIKAEINNINNSDIVIFDILFGANENRVSPRGFNFWLNFKTGIYHQASLCRSDVFNNIGGFDTDFKIAMDYDFFLRAYRNDITVQKLSSVLSVMRDTGISSRRDIVSVLQRLEEERKVHEKNCPSWLLEIIYKIYWLFYPSYKKLISYIGQ